MKNDIYLDTTHKFNERTFDKTYFFNLISQLLIEQGIPIDDFKANIYPQKLEKMASWDKDLFKIKCIFNWILYPEDIPKKEFPAIATKIEKTICEAFNININDDVCDCYRYEDSEYSGTGYDAELKLYITYDYDES